jgi:hypothetical protein
MRSNSLFKSSSLALLSIALAAGCAASGSKNGGSNRVITSRPTSAQRAIAEADIIQTDGTRLYALSKSGTASIVDISQPRRLELLGQTTVPGEPFEMYLRGTSLVVMTGGAVGPNGQVQAQYVPSPDAGSLVVVLDVSDPTDPVEAATLKVPGEIADSRVVGNILYIASYENANCYGCGTRPRTMVTTFNIASPKDIALVEQVSFMSTAPDAYQAPWGTNWKRSIFVNDQRLYVGGHGDIDPSQYGNLDEGIIDVLDITDPTGRLGIGAHIEVAGAILSRWQMDEYGGVLRVVSQRGVGRTVNGIGAPEVDTFRVINASTISVQGHLTMQLRRPEMLRSVRFDGTRAYPITFAQVVSSDPLFVIDLADPARPVQRGELVIPGFMYHLEPRGDRIIGLGVDRSDPNGSLNVSLFDVADPDRLKLLARVGFAQPYLTEDFAIVNEMAEDQDRIAKAFRVLPDGMVVVPFSEPRQYNAQGDACENVGGGVQLVQWSGNTLTKRALLPLPGNPRRAFEHNEEMLTVSDSNVRSFSLENPAVAHQTADLVIGTCVPDTGVTDPWGGGAGWEARPCSAAGHGRAGWGSLLLTIAALAAALRRRRAGGPGVTARAPRTSR